ncbi:hypothetical protein [Kitasatospora aureofaciens]|uniref:hypothetical protein n=1 Tax=Kitasatospora aureofaciens TaxID=1894 RepID=UPI0033D9AD02
MPDQSISTLEDLAEALDRVENRTDLEPVIQSWSQNPQSGRRAGLELIYDVYRTFNHEGAQ